MPEVQTVKEPRLCASGNRDSGVFEDKTYQKGKKKRPYQAHIAIFLRFMAANLSLNQFVTLARPFSSV